MENNIFDLTGKTAIVTGSLGLIGKNHCRALSEAGANVVVTDIDGEACNNFAAELPSRAIGFGADITDADSVKALRDFALAHFGSIDILVNNAAINDKFEDPAALFEQSKFENYPLDLWNKSLSVNVTGMFLCSQVIGTVMAERGAGSIINVASTYGIVAPNQDLYIDKNGIQKFFKTAAYPVTKGAVIAFTKFLAAYWGRSGVRVNTLSPGGVENNQDDFFVENYSKRTPLNRMARPDDYRGAVVFLASDASAYMTGANLVVDGGFTIW
ncbi:MAG: SDR family oxidoreductase [Ignavibacteriaceae bacterium]|nr:SDR family oxidoreductase [Ignavibacteriaceae bacterium]